MAVDEIIIDMETKPVITVTNQNREHYKEALDKTREGIREKMHNSMDYYCEQMGLFERFSEKAMGQDLPPEKFWSELMKYSAIHFQERKNYSIKLKENMILTVMPC